VPVEKIIPGSKIDDTNPQAYGNFYIRGETVDIRTTVIDRKDKDRLVKAAENLKLEFVAYLKREEIPFDFSDWVPPF